jgi:pyrimidine 5'-nucleotidase
MNSKEKVLVFDLDGTLYNINNGYMKHIRQNIFNMMVAKGYATSVEEATELWRPLFKKYNQSFKGLREGGYYFSNDDYWVNHRAGIEQFFTKDAALSELLKSLPHKKVIFTNAREKEAMGIMHLLGIDNYFDHVFGADFMGEVCKPQVESFQLLLKALDVQPENVVYFEDSVKNLRMASSIGIQCILINGETATEEGVFVQNSVDVDRKKTETGLLPGLDFSVLSVVSTLSDGGSELRATCPSLF